ncbi:MAG TPA: extracellular solute-binding protein [Thermomicrobiales bacterium]|jgi:ABC-type glycerol-3-phosphate transport system substrate-binding protein
MAFEQRINRRTLVKGAAAGAAGLAAAQPFYFRKSSAATEIQFWNPGNDPVGGPIIQKLVDDFNANESATAGFTVKNVPVPAPKGDYTKYTTAMTTSGSPDVVSTYSYDPFIPWVANGFVLPMDEQFQELGLSQDDFYPVAWEMVNSQGHIWGLLQEFDMVEFFWNTNIHSGAAPTTIDELDAAAAQYIKMDGDNLVQAGLVPWAQGGFSPGGYGSWGTIMNARFYDNDARKWTITADGNTAFLDWYLKYVDLIGGREKADALISSVPSTYGDVFLYGKTAFAMEGEFVPLELPAIGQGELVKAIQITHPPTIPGVTQGPTTMVDAANVFVIPVKSAHVKEAAYFSKYMVSQQALVAWATPIGQMLPTKAAATDPGLNAAQPWFKTFLETVDSGKLLAPPLSPQARVFSQAMALAVDNVTYKKKSPADALAECEQTVMQAVDEFKSSNPDWQGE